MLDNMHGVSPEQVSLRNFSLLHAQLAVAMSDVLTKHLCILGADFNLISTSKFHIKNSAKIFVDEIFYNKFFNLLV